MLQTASDIAQNVGSIRKGTIKKVLLAAERVFGRRGFAGSTIAEIVRQAGLPKANLHYYFGTKDRLYQAVREGIIRCLITSHIIPTRLEVDT